MSTGTLALDWVGFDLPSGGHFCYFPDSMTMLECDEHFDPMMRELTTGQSAGDLPEGYREDTQHNLEVLHRSGLLESRAPRNVPSKPPLRRLIIGNTLRCNLKCTYCYNQFPVNTKQTEGIDMALETLDKATAMLERLGPDLPYYEISFIGGEPLLRMDVIERAADWGDKLRAEGRDLRLTVTTNATRLTPERLETLKRRGVQVKVSLDGTAVEHDQNRVYPNGKGTYGQILRNITDYLADGSESRYAATVVDSLQTDLAARVEALADLGFDVVDLVERYEELDAEGKHDEAELGPVLQERYRKLFDYLFKRAMARKPLRVIPVAELLQSLFIRKPIMLRCRAGGDSLAVGPDGSVYACHHFFGDTDFVLTRVEQGEIPLEELAPYRVMVDDRPECNTCFARHLCGGPCYHRSLAATGEAFLLSTLECIKRRALSIETMRFFLRLQNADAEALAAFVNAPSARGALC